MRALVGIALLALCAAMGCGASDRAPDATAVADRFHAALGESDGRAACDELSEETESKLEQQEGEPCEEALLTLELPQAATAVRTSVYVTTASVALDEGSTTFLDEGPDGWEVAAAGCRPTAPELPFECELEG